MVRLSCLILIGKYEFDYANNVSITTGYDLFTDSATIMLPKKLSFDGKPIIAGENPIFKRGDAVEIWLGYDDNLVKEFEGFVANIKPSLPLEIICEDAMWLAKQSNFTLSYKAVNLKTLMGDVLGEAGLDNEFEADDIELGKFSITRANAVEVFEELKKTYGIITFIQGGKFYTGLPYKPSLQEEQIYNLELNVVDSADLIYTRADDRNIKVKAISIYPDNTKEEIELGDKSGEQRTFNFYDVPKEELEKTAQRELDRIKVDGYEGSLTGFGVPFVKHQDAVVIKSDATPERIGTYLCKGTQITFGVSGGFKRVVQLDKKI